MSFRVAGSYIEVLKPRATILLTFVGTVASFVAGDGAPPLRAVLLTAATVAFASAGANGLTNYLDRGIDARMARAKHRALPAKRISPPEKVLPLTIGLALVGLALAWQVQPVYRLAFAADLIGTAAALAWRKKATCIFPQGLLAGCAPVLIGWFAVTPSFGWQPLLLCGLIGAWLPLHVWSVMITHRQDYVDAGLTYFPMSRDDRTGITVLFTFSLALTLMSVALWLVGEFSVLYLLAATALGILMVCSAARLLVSGPAVRQRRAWRLYKLSSFPYLGLIFLAMGLDLVLR